MKLHTKKLLNKFQANKSLIKFSGFLAYILPILALLIIGITSMAALYRNAF